jgi:hypothetical protein
MQMCRREVPVRENQVNRFYIVSLRQFKNRNNTKSVGVP